MPLRQETLIRAFFEDTRDLIAVADVERKIVSVNKAFLDGFGYTESEIIGLSTEILYASPAEFISFGEDRYNRNSVDNEELYRVAYRKKNNEIFIGETRSGVIHDERQVVDGFIGIIRDVTETVERERFLLSITKLTSDTNLPIADRIEQLLITAQRYHGAPALILVASDHIADLMPNGAILSCIEAGHFAPELSGEKIAELCTRFLQHEGVSDANRGPCLTIDNSQYFLNEETLIIDGEVLGSLYLLSERTKAASVQERGPEVKSTLGTTIASQLKLAQQNRSLEMKELHFRQLYRRTPAITHSIDNAGNLTEISDAWLKLFDYVRSEVIGRKSSSFLTDDSRKFAVSTVLPKLWSEGFVDRVPYTFLTSGGLPIEIELSAIYNEDGTSLAVLEDVTERNAVQQELIKKHSAIEVANKELNQFAFIASHDLQEPLRKIQAFSDLLEEALLNGDTEDVAYAMQVIKNSASRSSRLISDLLTFSRISNRDLKPIKLNGNDAVREAISEMSTTISDHNATVHIDIPALSIVCDRAYFTIVIQNLVNNAMKFCASNTIPQVRISIERNKSHDVLKISDNGIGINPASAKSIFEPFKRLHTQSEYSGTGIGLAICKKIIDRHGWKIEVEQSVAPGATFLITIPIQA